MMLGANDIGDRHLTHWLHRDGVACGSSLHREHWKDPARVTTDPEAATCPKCVRAMLRVAAKVLTEMRVDEIPRSLIVEALKVAAADGEPMQSSWHRWRMRKVVPWRVAP